MTGQEEAGTDPADTQPHPFDVIADGIDALPAMVPGVCMPIGGTVQTLASWLRTTPSREEITWSGVPATLGGVAPRAAATGLYERLAATQHEIWSHWMRYLLNTKSEDHGEAGLWLNDADVARWREQAATRYEQLTEREKASDREQVDRYWHLLGPVDETDPGAIISAWRTIARLIDHEGYLSPASIADRVALLVEADRNASGSQSTGRGR